MPATAHLFFTSRKLSSFQRSMKRKVFPNYCVKLAIIRFISTSYAYTIVFEDTNVEHVCRRAIYYHLTLTEHSSHYHPTITLLLLAAPKPHSSHYHSTITLLSLYYHPYIPALCISVLSDFK